MKRHLTNSNLHLDQIDNELREVRVDLEFAKIGEIDTMNEKYNVDLKIKLSWTEDTIIEKYDKDKHWNPKIYIENLFSKPEETIEYRLSHDDSKTHITERRRVKGFLWERLELQNFPHDIQELSVTLVSQLHGANIKLVGGTYKFGPNTANTFVDQQKWKLLDLVECTTHASYDDVDEEDDANKQLLSTPKISFKCYARRRPQYYYANAYYLIFLITTCALAIFAIDCKFPQNRIQSTGTFLLTSISFKWVINRSLPTVSYTTLLDEYSIVCISFIGLLCGWHAIVGTHWKKETAVELDKWVFIGALVLYGLIHVYFFVRAFVTFLAIRKIQKKAALEKTRKRL